MATLCQASSFGSIFPTALAHFVSLCHILIVLALFKLFYYCYICYGDLGSMIFDVTITKRLQLAEASDDS